MAGRTMANARRRPDARPLAIDLQQLRFAVTAADIGSFRQAADALPLRQSQLTRCIPPPEHSIVSVVFSRSSLARTTSRPPRELAPSDLEGAPPGRVAGGSSLDDARRRFVDRPSESNSFAEPI